MQGRRMRKYLASEILKLKWCVFKLLSPSFPLGKLCFTFCVIHSKWTSGPEGGREGGI